jgi:hypothetical protein
LLNIFPRGMQPVLSFIFGPYHCEIRAAPRGYIIAQ